MAAKNPKNSGKVPASYKNLSARKEDIKKKLAENTNAPTEKFDEVLKQLNQVNALIEKRNKLNKDTIYGAKEYEDVLKSIGGKLDDQSKGYAEIKKALDLADARVDGMATSIARIPKSQKELRDTAYDAAAAYKQGNGEIQNAFASLLENKDANIDIAKIVQKQIDKQKEYITEIEKGGDAAKEILEANKDNLDVLEATKKAYASAAKDMKAMGKAGEMLSHTPLGGIINQGLGITKSLGITKQGNLGDVTKGLVEKRGLMGAAGQAPKAGSMLGALGGIAKFAGPAALIGTALFGIFKFVDGGGISKIKSAAKMLSGNKMMDEESIKGKAASLEGTEEFRKINAKYNYIKPLEERQTREKEMFDYQKSNTVAMIEYENSLVKDELSYQIGLKKDAIQFGFQQAMQTMEAEGARRKSLFLTGMSMYKKSLIVSERALNAIGSSTEAVFESIKEIGVQLGVGLSEQIKMATSAAGLSKTYGSSSEDVLKMTKSFRLMDKSSAKVAFNNVAGLSAFAKMNDMSPAQLFKQMADATEEVMKYSNMTTSQYANQAVLLSNMNSSMKDMAAASGTMVLNYKDSIKSEMSLSAMLGKNVNLSEVRARLMSGDMAGGASALKSALGGIDIGSMNAFQKQELSKSTGMGVDQLMELTQSKGGGVKGTLSEKAGLQTGADIAKGALNMDVSLAGQRLGMEQAQRKEMMKFEQRERLIMMQLEQAQKLKMLEVEAYFRVKYTKELEQSHEKQMAAAKHLEEMGSGIMMGGGKQLMDQAFAGLDKGGAGYEQAGKNLNSISGMVGGNQIQANDMRLAEYYNAQFELTEKFKNHPAELSKALKDTYEKIFADEAKAQREYDDKQKLAQLRAFHSEKTDLTAAIQYLEMTKETRGRLASKEEREKYMAVFNTLGKDMQSTLRYTIQNGSPTKVLGEFTERLKFITGEINKDPKLGSGEYLKRPAGMTYPGEKGYGNIDFKKGTMSPFGGNPTGLNFLNPAGTGGPGGGAPPAGPAPKPVANNYIVDTNSMVSAVNTSSTTTNSHLSQIVEADGVLKTETIKLNTQLTLLNKNQQNGYIELLRRTDATNTLLDTLIGATAEASAKPINISGKRVNDVMQNVKNRVYGITGA